MSIPLSELGPPPPTPQAKVAPRLALRTQVEGGTHSLLGEGVWGDPIQMKGQNLWYCMYTKNSFTVNIQYYMSQCLHR